MHCCKIDPVQRLQPTQALKHAFVQQVYTGTGEVAKEPANNLDTSRSFASGSHTDTPRPAGSASTGDAGKIQPSLPSFAGEQASSGPEQGPRTKEPEKARFLMLNPENNIRFQGHTASLHMTNNTRTWVAFKFKTTNPDIYLVEPTSGVIARGARQALQLQLQSRNGRVINKAHKFLVQAMEVASGGPVPHEKWTEVSKSEIQQHTLGAELAPEVAVKKKYISGSGPLPVTFKNFK